MDEIYMVRRGNNLIGYFKTKSDAKQFLRTISKFHPKRRKPHIEKRIILKQNEINNYSKWKAKKLKKVV